MAVLGKYEVHPFAEVFPLITDEDLTELVTDIERNGLNEPIVLSPDGSQIVDGRNRYLACEKAGIEPEYRTLGPQYGPVQIVDFIIAANLHRRHLTQGQRGMLALEAEQWVSIAIKEAEDKRKSKFPTGSKTDSTKAHVQNSEDSPVKPQTEMEKFHAWRDSQPGTTVDFFQWRRLDLEPPAQPQPDRQARTKAAKTVGVSPRVVSQAKAVVRDTPDLAEKVKAGTMSIRAADQERKKRVAADPPPRKTEPTSEQVEAKRKRAAEKTVQSLASAIATVQGAFTRIVDEAVDLTDFRDAVVDAIIELRSTADRLEALTSVAQS